MLILWPHILQVLTLSMKFGEIKPVSQQEESEKHRFLNLFKVSCHWASFQTHLFCNSVPTSLQRNNITDPVIADTWKLGNNLPRTSSPIQSTVRFWDWVHWPQKNMPSFKPEKCTGRPCLNYNSQVAWKRAERAASITNACVKWIDVEMIITKTFNHFNTLLMFYFYSRSRTFPKA